MRSIDKIDYTPSSQRTRTPQVSTESNRGRAIGFGAMVAGRLKTSLLSSSRVFPRPFSQYQLLAHDWPEKVFFRNCPTGSTSESNRGRAIGFGAMVAGRLKTSLLSSSRVFPQVLSKTQALGRCGTAQAPTSRLATPKGPSAFKSVPGSVVFILP